MWTGIEKMSALRRADKWKVEFFSERMEGKETSAFDFVPIKELVRERREFLDPQELPDHKFRYLSLGNVESLTGDLVGDTMKLGKQVRSKSKVFREGDVLYGRLRPNLNKVYLAEQPVHEGICSGEFFVLIPRQDVVKPHFLRELLSSPYVQRHVLAMRTGSALPRVQLEDLLDIDVPLPSLEDQSAFENFLLSQHRERREKKENVEFLQQATQEAFVRSLKSGEKPTIDKRPVRSPETSLRLPRKRSRH